MKFGEVNNSKITKAITKTLYRINTLTPPLGIASSLALTAAGPALVKKTVVKIQVKNVFLPL